MMDLENFTVDELTGWTDTSESSGNPDWYPDPWEVAALARVALAAKRAEPVAWVVGDEEIADFKNGREVCVMRDCDDEQLDYLPLYTTPQLNSPEIPDGWIKCSDRMPEDDQVVVIINSGHGFLYEAAVVTRRGPHFDLMDGLEASNYDGGAVVRLDMEATHWMQLPAAPEKPL
ncbi:TPA: DUF551 domain-containing protein [Yersinia enterocolitica]|nr:DUF551 domain-containing protein [Yersinia enterocolitica]